MNLSGSGHTLSDVALDITVECLDDRGFCHEIDTVLSYAGSDPFAVAMTFVTSDGDRQNDPRDIPAMVEAAQDYDIVAGWRKRRKDPFLNRRLPSMIANWIISHATGVKLHDYGCSLKVFRAEVVKPMKLYGEMHRFLPAIASEMGVTITEREVNHRPRVHGTSKYGISRTIRVILDLLTVKFLMSYGTRPIQIFGLLGLLVGGAGTLLAMILSYQRIFQGAPLANRPILLLAVVLIVLGAQFVFSGLLAEIQVRTYHESQRKPIYIVREILTGKERDT